MLIVPCSAIQDGEIPQFWNLYISVPVFKIELKYLIFCLTLGYFSDKELLCLSLTIDSINSKI